MKRKTSNHFRNTVLTSLGLSAVLIVIGAIAFISAYAGGYVGSASMSEPRITWAIGFASIMAGLLLPTFYATAGLIWLQQKYKRRDRSE